MAEAKGRKVGTIKVKGMGMVDVLYAGGGAFVVDFGNASDRRPGRMSPDNVAALVARGKLHITDQDAYDEALEDMERAAEPQGGGQTGADAHDGRGELLDGGNAAGEDPEYEYVTLKELMGPVADGVGAFVEEHYVFVLCVVVTALGILVLSLAQSRSTIIIFMAFVLLAILATLLLYMKWTDWQEKRRALERAERLYEAAMMLERRSDTNDERKAKDKMAKEKRREHGKDGEPKASHEEEDGKEEE